MSLSQKQTNDSFEMIQTVKRLDELWFSPDDNALGFDKELKSPRVDLEIPIEKTSVSSWVRTAVAAFLSERGPANENCHQNETEVNFISFTKTQQYFFEKPIGEFSQEAYNLTAGNSVRSKKASMAELLRRWTKVPMAKCPPGFEPQW